MSNNEIDKIWNYLLSNNELTTQLSELSAMNGGGYSITQTPFSKEKAFDSSKINKIIDNRESIGRFKLQDNYGIKMIVKDGTIGNGNPSKFSIKGGFIDSIISLIYFTNSIPSNSHINIISNYRYTDNKENKGTIYNEKLENIFEGLITNLSNQDLTNIIKYNDDNIIDGILTIKNKPINAIVNLTKKVGNYHLTFPVGSNIILIVYQSFVNCIISFTNNTDIICPPEKTCPEKTCPEKTCPEKTCPEKTCPVNFIPYIFIVILIIIVFIQAIFIILKRKKSISAP